MPTKKLTIGFVREQFEKENYTLLSEKYTNSSTKLKFRCPNNHEHSICWDKWRDGRRCRKCFYESRKSSGHPNWKGGPKESYCIDCEKKITYSALRCRKCQDKYKTGDKHHNYKNGKNKCIDCGKQLTNYNRPRCWECHLKHNISENHHSWQGGKSFEIYCQVWTDKEFKQYIRNRDNNIKWDIGYWWKGKLSIHHINYNKKNCNPDNLITVSAGMNSSANKDREWHTKWFQTLMEHRNENRSLSV